MRFRTKPVETDAIQWTGGNWDEIVEFTDNNVLPQINDSLSLRSGILIHLNWWLIKENDIYSTYTPITFEMTYEKVDVRLCEICGKEMMQVDCNLWRCPDYPHNAQEEYDCSIDDEWSHGVNTPLIAQFDSPLEFQVDPDGLYCPGCGKPKVLCLHDTSGCS